MAEEFLSTHLFICSLGQQDHVNQAHVDRLRESFLSVRRRISPFLALIPRDVPHLTIHDVTHLDALWTCADLILGDDYVLNPLEGYVLGVAFLLHDAGMTVAAYPNGVDDLRATPEWADAVGLLRHRLGRGRSLSAPDEAVVVSNVLRQRHAQQARRLAVMSWPDRLGSSLPLIEDEELRDFYGQVIGQIAHSHNLPLDQVVRELTSKLGSLPGMPTGWTIDPQKLACILRAADAAHINAERAPHFHRVATKPQGISDDHWNFQSRLYQPFVDLPDTLVFKGKESRPFLQEDISAWWLAHDAIRMLDREIRQCNDFLLDTDGPNSPRSPFRIRRVKGADSPERLATLIPTSGWMPVDTSVRVENPAAFVKSFGGAQLYGNKPWVALRELLQNAVDAIEARRSIDQSWPRDDGRVTVELSEDEDAWHLTVSDNGIGMSRRVLTGALLKFGQSFWRSEDAQVEFPGLQSGEFVSIGKFGIGFFSIFMICREVVVQSARFDAEETWQLYFSRGLDVPAILQPAARLRDGNRTSVRLRLSKQTALSLGVGLSGPESISEIGFMKAFLCQAVCFIAPATDVPIEVREPAGRFLIPRGFWRRCPAPLFDALLNCDQDRYWSVLESAFSSSRLEPLLQYERGSGRFSLIREGDGRSDAIVVGRATVFRSNWPRIGYHSIQGFRGEKISFVTGLVPGATAVASRLATTATMTREQTARLLADQEAVSSECPSLWADDYTCGLFADSHFDVAKLPLIRTNRGDLSIRSFADLASREKRFIILERCRIIGATEDCVAGIGSNFWEYVENGGTNRYRPFFERYLVCLRSYWLDRVFLEDEIGRFEGMELVQLLRSSFGRLGVTNWSIWWRSVKANKKNKFRTERLPPGVPHFWYEGTSYVPFRYCEPGQLRTAKADELEP